MTSSGFVEGFGAEAGAPRTATSGADAVEPSHLRALELAVVNVVPEQRFTLQELWEVVWPTELDFGWGAQEELPDAEPADAAVSVWHLH